MRSNMKVVKGAQRTRSHSHSESVQLALVDIVSELARVLGRQLLSLIVERDIRTIQRWISGKSSPGGSDERRLRNTYQVYQVLAAVEGDHTIRAWFMGMNPQLDDASPAESLANDEARAVMSAARAFVNGG